MKLQKTLSIESLVYCAVALVGSGAIAATITDQGFFNPSDVIIDFETFPSMSGTVPNNTALTNQYVEFGVLFSSEDIPDSLQTTDIEDSSGRFDAPFRILAKVRGGGAPTSGLRYAAGDLYISENGRNVSDMRVDFISPVLSFGMFIVDNDFSTARLQAFDNESNLLESVIVPQVSEGGSSYFGLDVSGTGSSISYFILDGNNNQQLDSTFIDELSFRPVPIPPALYLFVTALFGLGALLRNNKA